jgi:hypothetical protein
METERLALAASGALLVPFGFVCARRALRPDPERSVLWSLLPGSPFIRRGRPGLRFAAGAAAAAGLWLAGAAHIMRAFAVERRSDDPQTRSALRLLWAAGALWLLAWALQYAELRRLRAKMRQAWPEFFPARGSPTAPSPPAARGAPGDRGAPG